MASIKVVIRKRKNKQGLHPIIIRINHNRKSSILTTGQCVELKDWDDVKQRVRKSHPNSSRLNNFILKKLAEANDKLLELESNQEGVNAQLITRQIKQTKKASTFFSLATVYLEQLEDKGQFSRISAEKPRIGHFKAFLKHQDITFPEITEALLRQYQAYLSTVRGNGERSIANCLVVIRTLFNRAIRDDIVDRKHYPFGKGRIVIRFPQSVKIGLSKEEVTALEQINLEEPMEDYARNVWLLSFYFAGMRISDVLKLTWADFKDGRLYYKMGKNNKVLSLRVPNKAQMILDKYQAHRQAAADFVFPELQGVNRDSARDVRRRVANGTKKLNIHLGRVAEKLKFDKPLTMHIARHTFGNISGDQIPVQVLQILYRHSDITTTINYQKNFAHKLADEALDKVLNGEG